MKKYILLAILFLLSSCISEKSITEAKQKESAYMEYLYITKLENTLLSGNYEIEGKNLPARDAYDMLLLKKLKENLLIVNNQFLDLRKSMIKDGQFKYTLIVYPNVIKIYQNIPNKGSKVVSIKGGTVVFINGLQGVDGDYISEYLVLNYAGPYTYKTDKGVTRTIHSFNMVTELGKNKKIIDDYISIVVERNKFTSRRYTYYDKYRDFVKEACKQNDIPKTYVEFQEKCLGGIEKPKREIPPILASYLFAFGILLIPILF